MKRKQNRIQRQEGFILVITMLVLVILTLIGLSTLRTGKVEIQVAGNLKWSENSFYMADGGSQAAIAVVKEGAANNTQIGDSQSYGQLYFTNPKIDMVELTQTERDTKWPDENDIWPTLGEKIPEGASDPRLIIMPLSKVSDSSVLAATVPVTMMQLGKEYPKTAFQGNEFGSGYQKTTQNKSVDFNIWVHNEGMSNALTNLTLKQRIVK